MTDTKKCEHCTAEFSPACRVKGVLRKQPHRKYCFKCSPRGVGRGPIKRTKRRCIVCGKPYRGAAAKCYACTKAISRRRAKQWMVDLKGGRCLLCGYNNCVAALCFHHVEPDKKKFSLNATTVTKRATGELKRELAKCVLLCMNCHTELHAGIRSLPGTALPSVQTERSAYAEQHKKEQARKLPVFICLYCGDEFLRNQYETHCSAVCAQRAARRVQRPDKADLKKMVWEQPVSTVASRLGVSDNAVHKWCAQYDIKTPPRGHWQKKNATARPTRAKLKKLLWTVPTSHLAEQYGVSATTVARWCHQYGLEKPGPGYWRKHKTNGK